MAPLGAEEQPIDIAAPVRDAAQKAAAGELDAALGILSPVIDTGHSPVAARFVLAMTAWRMGRLDWALELVCGCHESAPMDGTIAEAMASLHAQVGNMVDSIYAAKLATALGAGGGPLGEFMPAGFPPFNVAYRAIQERPLFAQAKRDLAAGRLTDAIEKARQHVTLNAGDAEARGFYAAAMLRGGRASDAVEQLRALDKGGCDSGLLASLYARSLAAVGDFSAARTWHEKARSLVPADADVAAAQVADSVWLDGPDDAAMAAASWAQRFCPPPKPRAWRVPGERLTIAYLVAKFGDPKDAAAVAAVARAHDRNHARVIGYGSGAQSWDENAELRGSFDAWQDIGALDGATLARYVAQDGVGIIIDASGFAAPRGLQALARVATAVRVSWLGNPGGVRAPIYDAAITASGGREGDWCIGGGYPVLLPLMPAGRAERAVRQLGADVTLAQLCDQTVAAWSQILMALPDARLLLRLADAGRGNVDRLIERFGRTLAARIDLIAAERSEDFYARLDVALAPARGLSPRMAAEAVACGVPTVVFAGRGVIEPYGAFLRGISRDAAGGAGSVEDYVRRAAAMACTPAPPHEPAGVDAAAFAQAVERHATETLKQAAP